MIQTTLVTGATAAARESAIAAVLSPGRPTAVILEGMADGNSRLVYDESDPPAWQPQVLRIAPGCLCCAGNLVLRVTLNRLLRRPPAQLFISLADATHVDRLRAMLATAPYDALLRLEPVLAA